MVKERIYVEVDSNLKQKVEEASSLMYISLAAWVTTAMVEKLGKQKVNKPASTTKMPAPKLAYDKYCAVCNGGLISAEGTTSMYCSFCDTWI
jgi:hypothetical protein